MRISDWSSDVCSSDLRACRGAQHHLADRLHFVSPLFAVRAGSGRAATPSFVIFTGAIVPSTRSEEHTSELQSLMRISYAVFCLKKKKEKLQTAWKSIIK